MKSFISQINKNRKKTDFENGNPMEYWNFWRCTSGGVFFINLYKSETINVQKELQKRNLKNWKEQRVYRRPNFTL